MEYVPYSLYLEEKRAREEIEQKYQFLRALDETINKISTTFINVKYSDVNHSIQQALKRIGTFLHADRAYVFQLSNNGTVLSNTFEWCAPEVTPQIELLQNLPVAMFPWWMEQMHDFAMIHITDVSQLPPEASVEKELLQSQDISSLIVVPMVFHFTLLGFIGFDSVISKKEWTPQSGTALKLVGEMISHILVRKEQEVALILARDRAEEANRLKDQILANTSHELRTPLYGIIGLAESLLEENKGANDESRQKNLKLIIQSGQRLSHLVNDLLDLSKIKSNHIKLNKKPFNLFIGVELVVSVLSPLCRKKGLKIFNLLPPHSCWIEADHERMQQILFNIIGNAIKYTNQGWIKIIANAEPEKQMILLSVIDTGVGIASEYLEKIFLPFERVENSSPNYHGGTGLGLSIAKQLLELHDGQISVQSTVNEGSQFQLRIPALQDKNLASSDESYGQYDFMHFSEKWLSTNREGYHIEMDETTALDLTLNPSFIEKTHKLLIVDDEAINIQVTVNLLVNENYHLAIARTGAEALTMLQQDEYDLVLLDVMLPQFSGIEVCQQIRQTYDANELPVILLTAKNQVQDIVEGFVVGGNDYLTKPLIKEELLARIRLHLRLVKINRALSRFVPYQLLHFLNRDNVTELRLGDQIQKNMSILFSDIRDFTKLSEAMSPSENFQFLNTYFGMMEPVIIENKGFIDKYIGDAIMAIFGESPDTAVHSAVMMLEKLNDFNKQREKLGLVTIRIGIGINTGQMLLGTVGGKERMEGTVISDAVNLASRIENLNKQFGTSLLISEFTLAQLDGQDHLLIRYIDKVKVKGKSQEVKIYEIFNGDEESKRELKVSTLDRYHLAIDHYERGEKPKALYLFIEIDKIMPFDRVIQYYIERLIREGVIIS